MMRVRQFFRSLRHALRGLREVARAEQSFRLQLVAAMLVAVSLAVFPLATWERILLILMIAAVLVLEVMNSIVERLADALQPRISPMVREVKDMMAATVLLTSLTAVAVGVMILGPFFWDLAESILGKVRVW